MIFFFALSDTILIMRDKLSPKSPVEFDFRKKNKKPDT